MKRAKGPSNLHSPFSVPGLDSPPDTKYCEEFGVVEESDTECLRVDVGMYEGVGERIIAAISVGNEWVAGVGRITSSGDMISDDGRQTRVREVGLWLRSGS